MKRIFSIFPALLILSCGGGGGSSSGAPDPQPQSVVLPVPVGAALTQSTNTALSIQWEVASGAVDYKVSRGAQQLIVAEETQTRFRDFDLTPGQVYSYTIDALAADGTLVRRMSVSGVTASGPAELTTADTPPADVTQARSLTTFGWTPNPLYDTCPKWLHDAHWTFGPDNKAYPTWHAPVYEYADGRTCRFGHEHGQDQRQSNLYRTVGPIPFGYVNEQLSPGDPNLQRNEDHFGHKVAFFNGIKEMISTPNGDAPGSMQCDILFKLHQGTHSPDALKNNTHERFLNYKCPNGLEIRYKALQPFGMPNTFTTESTNQFSQLIATTGAMPTNQPSGADRRTIPAIAAMASDAAKNGTTERYSKNCDNCAGTGSFRSELLSIGITQPYYVSTYNNEIWQGGPTDKFYNNQNQLIFKFEAGPYWNVASSSRYYEPSSRTLDAKQIDLCFQTRSAIYNAADCRLARLRGRGSPVPWDSPASPFNGAIRSNEANFVELFNPNPTRERVYFDPYGRTSLKNDELPLIRSEKYPIRGYFRSTGPRGIKIKLSNWAGSTQCGGGICYTNFNFFRLRTGLVVDGSVHPPN
jgi:hypothetical protein